MNIVDFSCFSEVPPFQKVNLTHLTEEQIRSELLRLPKLRLDSLPLNRPVTMSILKLLFERYEIFKEEQSIHVCFYRGMFDYLRQQQHRKSICKYIKSHAGFEGWRMAFDMLVEAAWLRYQIQEEKH